MSKVSRNLLFNLGSQVVVLLLTVIAMRYIFHGLGGDVFGVILFALALMGIVGGVGDLGITSAIVREIAAHYPEDREYLQEVIQTAGFIYWSLYAAIAVIVYVAAPFLVTAWIHVTTIDRGTATLVLRVVAITALLNLPRAVYGSLFKGLQRMEVPSLQDVVAYALQYVGIVIILAAGKSLELFVAWIAVSYVLSVLLYVPFVVRYFSWESLVPRFSRQVARRNFSYSRHVTTILVTSNAQNQLDKAVVSKLLPLASFGYYSVASSLAFRAAFATQAVAQAALPAFVERLKHGDRSGMLTQYRKLQDLVCFGTVPLFASLVFVALPAFSFTFNGTVATQMLPSMTLLSIGGYLNAALTVPIAAAFATGRPELVSRSMLLALLAIVPVTIALIASFGLSAAGASWVVFNLLVCAHAMPKVCAQCLRVSIAGWYGRLGKAMFLGVATYGSGFALTLVTDRHGIAALSLAYAMASAAFALAGYVAIGRELREAVAQTGRRILLRLAPA